VEGRDVSVFECVVEEVGVSREHEDVADDEAEGLGECNKVTVAVRQEDGVWDSVAANDVVTDTLTVPEVRPELVKELLALALEVSDAVLDAAVEAVAVAVTLTVLELQPELDTVGDDEGLKVDFPVAVPVLDPLALAHPLEVPDAVLHAAEDSEVVSVTLTVPEEHPELVTVEEDDELPVDEPVVLPVLELLALAHPLEVSNAVIDAVVDAVEVADTLTVPELQPELDSVEDDDGLQVDDPVVVPVLELLELAMLLVVPDAVLDDVVDDNAEPVRAEETVTALLRVELQLLSPVTLGGAVAEPEEVEEGVQERSAVEPAAQSGAQPQGTQVALVDAPSAEEKVPAGHGVGFTEERGQ